MLDTKVATCALLIGFIASSIMLPVGHYDSGELNGSESDTLQVASDLINNDLPVLKLFSDDLSDIKLHYQQPKGSDNPNYYNDLYRSFDSSGELSKRLQVIASNNDCLIRSVTAGERSQKVDFTLNLDCHNR